MGLGGVTKIQRPLSYIRHYTVCVYVLLCGQVILIVLLLVHMDPVLHRYKAGTARSNLTRLNKPQTCLGKLVRIFAAYLLALFGYFSLNLGAELQASQWQLQYILKDVCPSRFAVAQKQAALYRVCTVPGVYFTGCVSSSLLNLENL